jgi:hypothetical protein
VAACRLDPSGGSAPTGPPVAAPKALANLSADEVNLVGCSVGEDFARVLRARQVGGGDPVTGVQFMEMSGTEAYGAEIAA